MRPVQLTINGEPRAIEVAETALLLEVLREQCGLFSVREGCGVGQCGTCTVLLDGRPVSSCLLLAALQDGRSVETLEGLGRPELGELDPIQAVFLEHEAFQCGYCTPGFILSVKALLAERPDPTPEEAREYLAGNLCRCGAYPEILKATAAASARLRGVQGSECAL
ncbi:MAG TPA: (2Fe-2S)-binding protein [Chloroflexota bacterium]|nr:(2Fe-2S)-binding protein [Chloroflexota bacterium]